MTFYRDEFARTVFLGDALSPRAGLPATLEIPGQREGPTAQFLPGDASCVTGTFRDLIINFPFLSTSAFLIAHSLQPFYC